ncbi:MAG: hypothetical protein KA533_06175 [Sphingobium sp.]|nr:hypothetical protein [Sphingobium sp.]MBP8670581.1 hypothetical protein [Sphingobium sp.]MBP9157622.1 hypothetical protein [Sphingobium sp.]
MTTFPSIEALNVLAARCNESRAFQEAAEWADSKIKLEVGSRPFWIKLYRGKIIDVMEYLPASNALGYDIVIAGAESAWLKLVDVGYKSWALISTGEIAIDGNLIEANRMHEAICILLEALSTEKEGIRNVA